MKITPIKQQRLQQRRRRKTKMHACIMIMMIIIFLLNKLYYYISGTRLRHLIIIIIRFFFLILVNIFENWDGFRLETMIIMMIQCVAVWLHCWHAFNWVLHWFIIKNADAEAQREMAPIIIIYIYIYEWNANRHLLCCTVIKPNWLMLHSVEASNTRQPELTANVVSKKTRMTYSFGSISRLMIIIEPFELQWECGNVYAIIIMHSSYQRRTLSVVSSLWNNHFVNALENRWDCYTNLSMRTARLLDDLNRRGT